jgi:hypothetical protein
MRRSHSAADSLASTGGERDSASGRYRLVTYGVGQVVNRPQQKAPAALQKTTGAR